MPVYSFAPGPLMANADLPPPFFGLRRPRTVVGTAVHRVARAMVHSTLTRGACTYNDVLAVEGISPIPIHRFLDVAAGESYDPLTTIRRRRRGRGVAANG